MLNSGLIGGIGNKSLALTRGSSMSKKIIPAYSKIYQPMKAPSEKRKSKSYTRKLQNYFN
jgi:hypothetical protein